MDFTKGKKFFFSKIFHPVRLLKQQQQKIGKWMAFSGKDEFDAVTYIHAD